MDTISIVLPVYKGESTLEKTLGSLLAQTKKFDELIIIDDASPDRSQEIIADFLRGKFKYKLISHEKNLGLAKSYNDGIRKSRGNLVITLHQDVILDPDALKNLTGPFKDKDVVAAGHWSVFPREIWEKFNFWQKCFFARFVGKELPGINGQFDCFRRSALEKAGLFDGVHFRSAGEDVDIVWKMKKLGEVVQTKAKLIHLQKIGSDFGPKEIIWKQKQHSEARGALLSLGRIREFSTVVKIFFREILVLALFVPYLNIISVICIVGYSFLYTGSVFISEYKNPRIFFLPFFNLYLLFLGFFYSFKGFCLKKQTI